MAKKLPAPPLLNRDGTSQETRFLAALDPASAPVDERSLEDLVAFARRYGEELAFYDEHDREAGDWSGLVDARLELAEITEFMRTPERFTPEKSPLLFRPHFVLFLSYLQVLRHVQGELNEITRRHLTFYYGDVLRMRRKPAAPDSVNLLVELAAGAQQALLPAGSTFSAGPDSLGNDRIYATDREVVINRAQIARLSSVHCEQRITGLREARAQHRNDRRQACMAMFEVALGDPLPGDPLPVYPDGRPIDFDFLGDQQALLRFAASDLYLQFFELRDLMTLKRRRDEADPEWVEINRLLEKAGRKRDPSFRVQPRNSRDFDTNFRAAVGGDPDFGGLPEVKSIYDLYDHRIRQDVKEFVRDRLFFAAFDDFVRTMQIKVRIDNEWREINRIIETAGRRRDPAYRIERDDPAFDPAAFDANLVAALGAIEFSRIAGVDDIDQYYDAVLRVEAHFFMSADEFVYVIGAVNEPEQASWDKVDLVLLQAHREKVHAARRHRLRQVRESGGAERGFRAMIRYALGEDPDEGESAEVTADLERLRPSLGTAADFAYLERAAATPDEVDWERVYRIVEIAQRNREGRPEPIPRREEWLNLHPAEDATTAAVRLGIEGEVARWRTFGQPPPLAVPASPPPPCLGWALSSPLLAMAEGRREVVLTLGFAAGQFAEEELAQLFAGDPLDPQSPLRFEVSTAKGWVEPQTAATDVGGYRELSGSDEAGVQELRGIRFRLGFGEDVDAITAPPVGQGTIEASYPVLRLMLRQIWDPKTKRFVVRYPAFRRLRLAATHVEAKVEGLRTILLQNDASSLDAAKPFEPFGTTPAVGSRLLLGHPELFGKKLDSLRFRIEWMGVPAAGHYANYPIGADPSFTARIILVDQRKEFVLLEDAPLFSAGLDHPIEVADVAAALPSWHGYQPTTSLPSDDDLTTWRRHLCWDLNAPDFQHTAYPAVAAGKAVGMAAAVANDETIVASDYQVNPPFTPRIKRLQVDYSSTSELRLDGRATGASHDRILHVHPFGVSVAEAERTADGVPFLPAYDNEGELYIGLREVRPPQTVSLLFQMAEGSADPDLELETVRWSCLSGDRWVDLDDRGVLLDTTRGLINSGIIELDLRPATPGTRLGGGLYWLRAVARRNSRSVCEAVAIHAQAVDATFVDQGNATDHYSQPLPPGTITQPAVPRPDVAAVQQPYTSRGGRPPERDRALETRVSERLRHKGRALSMWDYERLVLEEFPEVYKVRCVPADIGRNLDEPGKVEVIVIPDIRNKLPFDPFEPKAPANLLADIQRYLGARSPSAADLEVRNARYIAVKVRFAARFKELGNEGYFKQLLNAELNQFLSPWAYEEGADIILGGKIYANSIVNFLDRRPYVDYVADVRLFSSEDGENFLPAPEGGAEGYAVSSGRPDGVLVAARKHEIDLIRTGEYEQELRTGINYMRMELDLIVA